MNKIKILAMFGIFIAIFDFLFRGIMISYSSPVGGFLYLDNLFMIGTIPLIAILSSYGLVKGKIFGLIFSIVLILISLVKIIGIFGSDNFAVLTLSYLIIYSVLTFYSRSHVHFNIKVFTLSNVYFILGLGLIFFGLFLGFVFEGPTCGTCGGGFTIPTPELTLIFLHIPYYLNFDYSHCAATGCAISIPFPVFLDLHLSGLFLILLGHIRKRRRDKLTNIANLQNN
ncbi:hypothetical protein A3C23_02200 [Candidatus Roizmanbacteria bacterium RIFCSPHIGHO2_02_FULL_37_13b]|uniref:Uncharacterized protein n=1 Tax=Candidatus Roizmanbacteria bacterium RIFCSPLOWO2_02_FULL_36_11 TaxID=1802071 RepID=A0A1F7JGL6_9BACT|nr:MAG: hypothetical protein A3C23_02200 [Candidatus Roizmanbacteria bacterium RIFCSPHIGHO2_02_FULL_37_13b]OGK54760.1 MAG: hypothetical protein A3H78_05730 [Candidatus Roizmanbacteria bacterium RIFCSPLOWO2_02_FULL_36_11]